MSWIDAHSHVWTPDTDRYPRAKPYPGPPGAEAIEVEPEDFSPEILFDYVRPSEVDRVVLIQMSFYGTDNSYIADCITDYPKSFRGVAYVDQDSAELAETMEALLRQGMTGFRIVPIAGTEAHWLQSRGFDDMFDVASQTSQAVCPLVSPDALAEVERMCARHPGTTFVIDHMGGIGADGVVRDREVNALCGLAKYPGVNVKVSAFYALGQQRPPHDDLVPMIRRLFDAFGAERPMWASDCPFQVQSETYEDSISLVRDRLDFLSADEREKVLRDTADRVFFYR